MDEDTFYIGRVRDFNRFVAAFRAPKTKPTLYFLHFLMPHGPWLYAPSGRVRAVARPPAPGRTRELWTNPDLTLQAWQRHLLQAGYTDRLLGRFIRRLGAVGLWDRALVVVGPDHGISFRAGDLRRNPTPTNLSELAFIPFFMKLPGQKKGRIVDTHISIVDILPTIADAIGVEIPWQTAGRSALEATEDRPVVQVGTRHGAVPRGPRAAPALARAADRTLRQRRVGWSIRRDGQVPNARRATRGCVACRASKGRGGLRRRDRQQALALAAEALAALPLAARGVLPARRERRLGRPRPQWPDRRRLAHV